MEPLAQVIKSQEVIKALKAAGIDREFLTAAGTKAKLAAGSATAGTAAATTTGAVTTKTGAAVTTSKASLLSDPATAATVGKGTLAVLAPFVAPFVLGVAIGVAGFALINHFKNRKADSDLADEDSEDSGLYESIK